ncbi:glycosyltransferase family 4 protein [Rothia nasimurium]|uniref:glycosyltransferase family 4 protein n=2 Tax=Rothia nasimurium TaxID=85336 RepID=UPI001F2871BA|nr:glycosyltransferase family 4 protein [Rothia nasimurium]
MRVGLLTSWDMTDPSAWSGVVYPAVGILQEKTELVPLQVPQMKDSLVDRFITRFLGNLGLTYLPSDAFATTYWKTRRVKNIIKEHELDVVISLAASKESLGVPSHIPVIQVTDSSFRAMIKGYFKGRTVSKLTLWQGQLLDRLVARHSAHYCLASEWSAEQLIKDVGILASDTTIAPFGPGIPPSAHAEKVNRHRGINLLFIASDWKRKGGDRALESFALARAHRPDLTLTVVGAPEETPIAGVTYLPRQSKEDLSALYSSHDALLEPTEASAGGVVVTDALNHGLPVISTCVGGIPTLVKDGKTGWLVSPENAVEEIANLLRYLTDEELRQAAHAAQEDAAARLTWDKWGKAVVEICEQVMKNSRTM